jgi:hypothetical protein
MIRVPCTCLKSNTNAALYGAFRVRSRLCPQLNRGYCDFRAFPCIYDPVGPFRGACEGKRFFNGAILRSLDKRTGVSSNKIGALETTGLTSAHSDETQEAALLDSVTCKRLNLRPSVSRSKSQSLHRTVRSASGQCCSLAESG